MLICFILIIESNNSDTIEFKNAYLIEEINSVI